jgi:hypothetical protein
MPLQHTPFQRHKQEARGNSKVSVRRYARPVDLVRAPGGLDAACPRKRDTRNLDEPAQVGPGVRKRRGHEGRTGIPQQLRAVVRQRRMRRPARGAEDFWKDGVIPRGG